MQLTCNAIQSATPCGIQRGIRAQRRQTVLRASFQMRGIQRGGRRVTRKGIVLGTGQLRHQAQKPFFTHTVGSKHLKSRCAIHEQAIRIRQPKSRWFFQTTGNFSLRDDAYGRPGATCHP